MIFSHFLFSRSQILSILARTAIIFFFFVSILEQSFVVSFAIFLSIFLSFLPGIIEKNTSAHLPWSLDAAVSFTLLLHVIGISLNLYHLPDWWWWDELTHFSGSFVVGMVAFHLIFTLNFLGKVVMSTPMMGLFLFLSAMGIGGIWEIAEFYSDIFLGTHTQISLQETIRDLQFDFLGAALISAIAMQYFYVQREENAGEIKKI